MRLTLRYLLAYLDDYLLPNSSRRILDPEDFETIGKKVQESEYARSLVERIGDVVRRGRLGAPSEHDRSAGLDPNTVAEYLDNALPDARVPDFEKVCLESDVHLAEVACCHQILAMVVTEPVEVAEETRQQVYQLPEALALEAENEGPSLPADDVSEESEEPEDARRPTRGRGMPDTRKRTASEGIRSEAGVRRWSVTRTATGLAALAVLVALVIPFGESGNLLSSIWEPRISETGDDAGGVPSDAAAATSPPTTVVVADVAKGSSAAASVPADSAERNARTALPPPGGNAETAKSTPAAPPGAKATLGGQEAPPKDVAPIGDAAGKSAPPVTAGAMPDAMAGDGAAPAEPGASPRPKQSGNVQAGLMASSKQVLLRLNAKGVWQRVSDEAALLANDQLLAVPAFHPRLALAGRTTVELVDATSLALLPAAGSRPLGVSVQFGRVLAKADEAGGGALRIVAGDRCGVCRFADADSVAALEVGRAEAGAGDPETQPGPWTADLYVISGKIAWRDDQTNKEIQLKAPARLSLSEQPLESVLLQQLPRWVSGETASPLDQRGAAILEREVALGRSADMVLRELSGDPKREVRWLATRTLSLVEDYQPLLKGLDDPEQPRFWSDYIEQLRAAVFRGPQSAANVRKAMERQYGPQGAELYELLWKYRADSLQPEDLHRLVDYLGHGALAFRVVGFWNLKNLYAKRTLYYRPEDSPAKRQTAIQKWREKLKTSPMPRSSGPTAPQPTSRDSEEEGSSPPSNDK